MAVSTTKMSSNRPGGDVLSCRGMQHLRDPVACLPRATPVSPNAGTGTARLAGPGLPACEAGAGEPRPRGGQNALHSRSES